MAVRARQPDTQLAPWGEFVPLPENASAVRAARRLVRAVTQSGSVPSPLVLHGPPGTGKSALVRELVKKVAAHPSGRSARVVNAGDVPRPDDGDDDWDGADLLALEDLHRLPKKAAGLVCRALDARAARRRLTVVTAAVGPAGLTNLPRRLTSRLAGGLVVQLEPLSKAGRRVLIAHFARKRRVRLADDALDWLAARPTGGGLRPLLGDLEKLAALARGVLGSLDADAVKELLKSDTPAGKKPVERIVAKVAAAFDVKPKDVLGKSRQRAVLVPRQVAMYLAREVAKWSLPRIGAAFDRDHTTVLHACRKVEAALKQDAKLKRTVRELKAALG